MSLEAKRYLMAGLGNPGRRFRRNRHNVGFMLVDSLAEHLGTSFRKVQSKALLTQVRWGESKILLAKPQTMMNLSGQSVGSLVRYYRIPLERLIVVYDDLDLPHATLRLRSAGGSGGHKGLQSIIHHVGSQDFPRLRIGIGRPPGMMDPADYVLQDFTDDERETLEIALREAVDCLHDLVVEGVAIAMTRCNDS